jgi:hypothetical protein
MKRIGFLPVLVAFALVAAPALADGGANHQVKQTPPVKMGTSGGSSLDSSRSFCCGGTLGSLVLRDGVLSILSNNHVLARAGSATTGEDDIQPGLIDVGCRATTANSNIVGDFAGNFVPLGTANVDVALATARSGQVDTSGAIIDVGVPCNTTQAATIGLAVTKSGRTTGQTFGSVQSVNTSVSIQYQAGCNSGKKFTETYTNQVVVSGSGSFSAGGDSGSLIVSNDGTPNPVALLFAGNSTQTIGNPIGAVVSAFQAGGHTFSFVGTNCGNFAFSSILGGPQISPSDAEVDYTRVVKERHESELFGRPGVIGVGVGADEADASRGAIVVYFATAAGTHPQPQGIPAEVDGVPVRVVPTEPFAAQ